jgi:hypothetical protein
MRSQSSVVLKIAAEAIPFFLFACGRSNPTPISDASTVTGAGGSVIETGGTPGTTSPPDTLSEPPGEPIPAF